MQRCLLALLVAGCGSSVTGHDASMGSTLAVAVHADVGMVVSDPPGIRCGICQMPQTTGVPCPAGPTTDRTCSIELGPGTHVSLALVGEDRYTDFVCASEGGDDSVKACDFVFMAPVVVGVWGEVPAL
jgi:hypothetical protein